MAMKNKIPINKEPWDKESMQKFEIDPNLYIHLTIIEALQAVPKGIESGKIENGFMALDNAVEQLEQILRARGMITETISQEFEKEIDAEREKLSSSFDGLVLNAKIANFKLKRLMNIAFKGKALNLEMFVQ